MTTLDGRQVSMDGLEGQVVLIDFWATWCAPCREALPRIREIAHQFEGKPLVVLSISLDKDQDKWKSFVDKNRMTWLQYRDASSDVSVARIFGVSVIPQTFTIDADGVLEDQHVGDADIERKIRKLVARALEKAAPKPDLLAARSPPPQAEVDRQIRASRNERSEWVNRPQDAENRSAHSQHIEL